MQAVLGIDTAWTSKNPSGVALIRTNEAGLWQHVGVAPSYDSFIKLAKGIPVNWDETPKGGGPEPERLLEAAEKLLCGGQVTVVSIDMPLSNKPISCRRLADKKISSKFGGSGAAFTRLTKIRELYTKLPKPLIPATNFDTMLPKELRIG